MLLVLRLQIEERRVVDQEEIHVARLQLLQSHLHRLLHVLRLPIADPDLCRDEHILALNDSLVDALLHGSTDLFVVSISTGRIDHAVAILNSRLHSLIAGVVRRKVRSTIRRRLYNPTPVRSPASSLHCSKSQSPSLVNIDIK